MVKPGGTGSPRLLISASPAPLPPNNSRIAPRPSAAPAPKRYTHFVIGRSSLDLREIGHLVHHRPDARQQAQAIFPQRRIIGINGHLVEKFINRPPQGG